MKTLLVARKYLLEIWREPQLLLLTVLMPAAMMLVMAFGYGQNPKLVTYNLLVLDQSNGQANDDVKALEAARYKDGRPIFQVNHISTLYGSDAILRDKTAAGLVIFTLDEGGKLARTVKGDATNMAFIYASGSLEKVLTTVEEKREGLNPVAVVTDEDLSLHMPQTDFDAFAPGVMIMAILLLIPQTATLIGREIRSGTIKLLQMSPLSTMQWFAGISLAQMVTAFGQVLIMLVMAGALGFHMQGSLVLAIVICLILSFSSIGLGLMTACLINNDSEALNTGSVFSMVQVFLSGAFFPFNSTTLLTIGGHEMGAFDLIPATHAMTILRQSLVCGAGYETIAFRLWLMVGLSILYFLIGIVFFSRRFARN
jgi:ABC-type polysaccharide/polyol phosphate export permease